MAELLTPQQVDNWRHVLASQLGPYAFLMTPEQITAMRDRVQRIADMIDRQAQQEAEAIVSILASGGAMVWTRHEHIWWLVRNNGMLVRMLSPKLATALWKTGMLCKVVESEMYVEWRLGAVTER